MEGCEAARDGIQRACDDRALAKPTSGHIFDCTECRTEVDALLALEALLASEPPVEVPADLRPSVLALVRADIARARRNARIALAGAIAALVAAAFGLGFFDVLNGLRGLANDAISVAEQGRALAPSMPSLPSIEVSTVGVAYGLAFVVAVVAAVAIELRVLARRVAA